MANYKGEIDFNTDWGGDGSTGGLPVEGGVIQKFVRSNLANSFRAFLFDPNGNRLKFFATDNDREEYMRDPAGNADLVIFEDELAFSGKIRQVHLANLLPSNTLNVTTNQGKAVIRMSYVLREKDINGTAWEDTLHGATIKTFVDVGSVGNYIEIVGSEKYVQANETYEFDVYRFLASGANRVRIQATADDDNHSTGTAIYSVFLSEMYIEPMNLDWFSPFIEGEAYNFGGFRVVGSLQKTLHLRITKGDDYAVEYEKFIGNASYTSTPLFFLQSDYDGDMFPATGTGIYKVEAWLTSGQLTSTAISYSIMCVAAKDRGTAKLVVVNEVAEQAYNFDHNTLFRYSLYNQGLSMGSPHFLVAASNGTSTNKELFNKDIESYCGTNNPFDISIEWNVDTQDALSLNFIVTLGDSGTIQIDNIPINNEGMYPATRGYVFYLNPATRNNGEDNRTSILNESASVPAPMSAEWTRMSWVNGIDGWTNDDEGRKCLRIPATSKVVVPDFKPLSGENIAIELTYKVSNVADYGENIITIANNPTEEGFHGIVIKPTQVIMHHSSDGTSANDLSQGTTLADETVVNLLITITPRFNSSSKNLVTGFVNGVKAFMFDYANVSWNVNAPLVIGSSSADVFVYNIRAYGTALGTDNAENNYISSLADRHDRIAAHDRMQSVIDNKHAIDYDVVKNNGYNFFTIEFLDGGKLPGLENGTDKKYSTLANLEMHYGEHPEWDFKLYGVKEEGQGTTSMNYHRWNQRWRINKTNDGDDVPEEHKKKVEVAYFDKTKDLQGNVTYTEKNRAWSKTVFLDGGNGCPQNSPAVTSITAKINFASSMQSHKIGATRAYTILHNAVVGYNEAQQIAKDTGKPIPLVSVRQYPAFGFEKKPRLGAAGQYVYEFIGLYTIGADKGDKPTFGYDLKKADGSKLEETLITLEGTDHTARLATFSYPWNSQVVFGDENLSIKNGAASTAVQEGWEVSNIYGLDGKSESDNEAITAILEREFKPAYEVAYGNSTLIRVLKLGGKYGNTKSEILSWVNANTGVFNAESLGNGYTGSDYQFWIEGDYVLYYFNIQSLQYEPGVNLVEDLGQPVGSTAEEKNEWFKQQRRIRFKSQAADYWDIDDAIFHHCFLLMLGATDNYAKNTYPYIMKPRSEGGRWKWRQDDLDTIFDIDNLGHSTKPYFIEYEDQDGSKHYYQGSQSSFWTLVHECYTEEIRAIGKSMIDAMVSEAGGSNAFDGVMKFFKKQFWDNAQNYFTKSAYNMDATYKYEEAFLNRKQSADPLQQALGDHYLAENLWAMRRAIYACSLFRAGAFAFGAYDDESLGAIKVRALINPSLKPVIAMYPAVHVGQSATLNSDVRIMPESDDSSLFENPSSGNDTELTIPAVDWMAELGDFSMFRGLSTTVLPIKGKRLRRLKVGDADESKVQSNMTRMTVEQTPSLEVIDARNTKSLVTQVDLTECTRLREALFDGSNATAVLVPNGSKIETLHLGDNVNHIQLRNLKFLTDFVMPEDTSKVLILQVEGCENQDSLQMMENILAAEGKTVRTNLTDTASYNILNTYINSKTGAVSADASWVASERFDVSGYESIYVSIFDNQASYSAGAAFYDENDMYISGILGGGSTEKWKPMTVNVPTNAKYFRSSFNRTKNGTTVDGFFIYGERVSSGSSLKYIRVLWDNVKTVPVETLSLLADIAKGSDEGVYRGIDIEGNISDLIAPRIEGTIKMESGLYMEDLNAIDVDPADTEDYDSTYKIATAKKFGTLKVIYNPNLVFISFADDEVKRIALGLWDTNGDGGITLEEAAKVTQLGTAISQAGMPFNENQTIKSFNEFRFFTNCTSIMGGGVNYGAFRSSSIEEITLPSSLKTIGAYAFQYADKLHSVGSLEEITSIGEHAFRGTADLEVEIVLPKLASLGSYAFAESGVTKVTIDGPLTTIPSGSVNFGSLYPCPNLTEVKLPSTLISTPQYLFHKDGALEKVDFSGAACSIGANAFQYCSALTQLLGVENVKSLGNAAFFSAGAFEVNFPALTTIGVDAFNGSRITKIISLGNTAAVNATICQSCTSLTEVKLPAAMTSLGNGAFNGCTALTKVDFSGAAVSISYDAFRGCSSLTQILDAQRIVSLGNGAFHSSSLEGCEINFPSLTSIGNMAFYSSKVKKVLSLGTIKDLTPATSGGIFQACAQLEEVHLPASLERVGQNSFYNCYALTLIDIPNENNIKTIEPNAFRNTRITGEFNFPNLESIGNYAFCGAGVNDGFVVSDLGQITGLPSGTNYGVFSQSKVTKVVFPATMTAVGSYAFADCSMLEEINLEGVEYVRGNSFIRCSSLKVANLLSIVTINQYAFYNCPQLRLAIMGENLTTVETECFDYCRELQMVIKAVTPPTCGANIFRFWAAADTFAIYVPTSAVADYQAASGWSTYASRIKPFDEVEALPSVGIEGRYYLMNNELYYFDAVDKGYKKFNKETGNWEYDIVAYDYIRGDGTAYIDLGVPSDKTYTWIFDFKYTGGGALFGSVGSNTQFYARYIGGNYLAVYPWTAQWGSNSISTFVGSYTSRHTLKISPEGVFEDDSETPIASIGTYGSYDRSVYLFANHSSSGEATYKGNSYCYGIRIFSADGALIRDFIPCTNCGIAGLYDSIEQKFYGNAADSGSLIASND